MSQSGCLKGRKCTFAVVLGMLGLNTYMLAGSTAGFAECSKSVAQAGAIQANNTFCDANIVLFEQTSFWPATQKCDSVSGGIDALVQKCPDNVADARIKGVQASNTTWAKGALITGVTDMFVFIFGRCLSKDKNGKRLGTKGFTCDPTKEEQEEKQGQTVKQSLLSTDPSLNQGAEVASDAESPSLTRADSSLNKQHKQRSGAPDMRL